jgi:hypothetical protein
MRHRHESLNLKFTVPISQSPIRFLADATIYSPLPTPVYGFKYFLVKLHKCWKDYKNNESV